MSLFSVCCKYCSVGSKSTSFQWCIKNVRFGKDVQLKFGHPSCEICFRLWYLPWTLHVKLNKQLNFSVLSTLQSKRRHFFFFFFFATLCLIWIARFGKLTLILTHWVQMHYEAQKRCSFWSLILRALLLILTWNMADWLLNTNETPSSSYLYGYLQKLLILIHVW